MFVVGGYVGENHGSVAFLVVNVGQEGFFSEFLEENNVKTLLEVLQKKRGRGLLFCVVGDRTDCVDQAFG